MVQMGKTHGQMIKFASVDDVDFCKVSKVLAAMITEAVKQSEIVLS